MSVCREGQRGRSVFLCGKGDLTRNPTCYGTSCGNCLLRFGCCGFVRFRTDAAHGTSCGTAVITVGERTAAGKQIGQRTQFLCCCGTSLVQKPAVYADNTGDISGTFHAAFNFQGSRTELQQLRNVGCQTVVAQRKRESLCFITDSRFLFGGFIFCTFHLIRQTAWLCTGTAIAASAADKGGKQASAGLGNAHCTVNEQLCFNRGFSAYRQQIGIGKLSCGDHAGKSERGKEARGIGVVSGALRACVKFD